MLPPVPEPTTGRGRLITADDFRDFTFTNAVRLWGKQNPRFFEGTRVAKEAAALLPRGARADPHNSRISRMPPPLASSSADRKTALFALVPGALAH